MHLYVRWWYVNMGYMYIYYIGVFFQLFLSSMCVCCVPFSLISVIRYRFRIHFDVKLVFVFISYKIVPFIKVVLYGYRHVHSRPSTFVYFNCFFFSSSM